MKCPNCNFENDSVSNFCINCGTKLKVNDFGVESYSNDLNYSPITSSENKIIYSQYDESNDMSIYSSEDLNNIFSENKFTIGQINKIQSFIKENHDKSSIDELIKDEISNNNHQNKLLDEEYDLLFEFSKKIMIDDLNQDGVPFIRENGSKTITTTKMKTITEEIPVVKQKHGGLVKGAATLGFGLIGLAGTSGVKTEMQTVEKQVPIQVQENVKDTTNVILNIKDNRLEIRENDLKTIINFSKIEEITEENNFIYIKSDKEMINLKICDNYFADLLTKSLSENIYYLKDYHAITNNYLNIFSKDLNNVWISEILAFNIEEAEPSEIDKIELIKEYYSLKESGIITEEEFQKKKQELLN